MFDSLKTFRDSLVSAKIGNLTANMVFLIKGVEGIPVKLTRNGSSTVGTWDRKQ